MSETATSRTKAASIDGAGTSGEWTKYLPAAFGIREAVESSPFRWCVRESFMWGIATGTTMGLHRIRMKSHPLFAINVAFGVSILVTAPTYYFCYRRREHKEEMIEMMMKANDFSPVEEMPTPVPISDHPFLATEGMDGERTVPAQEKFESGREDASGSKAVTSVGTVLKPKEYRGWLRERKDWQKAPTDVEREASHIFQEVPSSGSDDKKTPSAS